MNWQLQQFMGPRPPDIEAICNDCGQKFAAGCVQYRSLDAYDDDPEAYCPECDGSNLAFPMPKEDA
jgi:hypothetical protein